MLEEIGGEATQTVPREHKQALGIETLDRFYHMTKKKKKKKKDIEPLMF